MHRITLSLVAAAVVVGLTLATATAGAARKPAARTFHVALTGEAETPTGDPVGTGTATLRMRKGQARVCYTLSARNIPRAIAAHIHRGKTGTAGVVVVPLKTPNASGTSKGCAKAKKSLVRSMLAHPRSYYVNVHTGDFPAGAIRGQLKGTSTKSFGTIILRTLNGTTEPNATGSVVLRIRRSDGLICFRLRASNITLPAFAAHIHRGAAGTNGPVVVPLTAPGTSGTSDGCVTVDQSLIDQILANPAGFYVNVHTVQHKGGAIRTQLA
jgi:hypothetical protein